MSPETRPIGHVQPLDAELQALLAQHKTYVNSRGKQGKLADLTGADLTGADLSGIDLRGATLRYARLDHANLLRANLQGADLRGASLQGANLDQTKFEDTILIDADLSGAKALVADSLAGCNLTNASLPAPVGEFDGLSQIATMSMQAGKTFLSVLFACFYSWLTIFTTTDARLLTNSTASPLPIIGTSIPIVGFYWVGPAFLVALYLYFHLYLQRLWSGLASLPAVFPDGHPVHHKVNPWLLSALARADFILLRDEIKNVSRLENGFSVFAAWASVPITLAGFWLRYLPKHDWRGTALHIVLLAGCTVAAFVFQSRAIHVLRGEARRDRLAVRPWWRATAGQGIAAVALAAAAWLVSAGAIDGRPSSAEHIGQSASGPRTWVGDTFALVGYRTWANFHRAEVSTKPAAWLGTGTVTPADLAQVKGAALSGADLRFADGYEAFLVKADLTGARLAGASLIAAELIGADFTGADMRGTDLTGAKLQYAVLIRADLTGTNFTGASLDLADLSDANLAKADFTGTRLSGANLAAARNLTQAQFANACGDAATKLPKGLTIKPCQ